MCPITIRLVAGFTTPAKGCYPAFTGFNALMVFYGDVTINKEGPILYDLNFTLGRDLLILLRDIVHIIAESSAGHCFTWLMTASVVDDSGVIHGRREG
jgi:hypothetical protein